MFATSVLTNLYVDDIVVMWNIRICLSIMQIFTVYRLLCSQHLCQCSQLFTDFHINYVQPFTYSHKFAIFCKVSYIFINIHKLLLLQISLTNFTIVHDNIHYCLQLPFRSFSHVFHTSILHNFS